MRNPKFTFNALLLVILLASAFLFFIMIMVFNMASRLLPVNMIYPLENTDLLIRYSNLEPDGIYEGTENVNTLRVPGTFGYDWGAALEGDRLYVNEYDATDLGLTLCNLTLVDLAANEKQVLYPNTILRGRCASGELVCVRDTMIPANHPQESSLCAFYSLTSKTLRPESGTAQVLFLDPETGEILYQCETNAALDKSFAHRYLERTLAEVRG